MRSISSIEADIFTCKDDEFEALSLEVFRWQAEHVAVYRQYLSYLNRNPKDVQCIADIPFLPLELFRTQQVIADGFSVEKIFRSSTTTGTVPSSHFVASLELYKKSFSKAFEYFYGNVEDYCILALLPSYLERDDASLVYMAKSLIQQSKHPQSGFYLQNQEELIQCIQSLQGGNQKILLLGVTFALLDLAEQFPLSLKGVQVMETGGMKGRRKEMTRTEVHTILRSAFQIKEVHSEYGMTELLSQAYSLGQEIFECPPWMKVFTADVTDPFSPTDLGKTGTLQIVDLANLYSCSFLASSDLGKVQEDGKFEILGRVDRSMVRGCNLMVE